MLLIFCLNLRKDQLQGKPGKYFLARGPVRLGVPRAPMQVKTAPQRVVQECSGAVTRGTAFPAFFDRGDASPTPPTFFGLKFVQKLVHCCNWLLTEMQCKIISVQQN